MKKIVTGYFVLTLSCMLSALAQEKGPVLLFKDKTIKINTTSVFDIRPEEDLKTIKVRNLNKNDESEILFFDENLKFQKKEIEKFDLEVENKQTIEQDFGQGQKVEKFFDKETGEQVESIVLQENLIRVKGSIIINNQVINAGLLSKLQLEKGPMLHQFRRKKELLGGYTSRELTFFSPQEEVKLKTEEGKNMAYVTHKTLGEEFLFRNSAAILTVKKKKNLSNVDLNAPYAALGVIGAPTDLYASGGYYLGKPKTLMTGDILLVGLRPNNLKFAKAPTAEELLPYYYIFRVDSKTLDVTHKSNFQEPFSRGVTFAKNLTYAGGILIVSTPYSYPGDASPKDQNPRNYVIRHISEEAIVDYEINYEMPSGYTRFENCFEQPDGSLILWASVDSDKKEKHFNKKVTGMKGFETDQFLSLVIKDGKVISSQIINKESAQDIVVVGTPNKKKPFSMDINKMLVQEIRYYEGGMLVFGSIPQSDPANAGIAWENGYACMQFDKDGRFVKVYWMPTTINFASQIPPTVSRISENEFVWITSERVSHEKAYHNTKFVTINTATGTVSAPVIIGDENHMTYPKFPSYIDPETKQIFFFGFDEGGKELWMQRIILK